MSLRMVGAAMPSPHVPDKSIAGRHIGAADRLRLAAVLTIIAFHVSLRAAQSAARAGLPSSRLEDALIGGAALFDNRSLAVLSLYLLLVRHRDCPLTAMLAERARRLLVPYAVWTVVYALLDLSLATLAGHPNEMSRAIGDPGYWIKGLIFASTTPHLHFLPTLFVLTLLLPLTRFPLPIPVGIALLCLAAALRALLEAALIPQGLVGTAGPTILAPLTAGRLLESLPTGFLAARLALGPALTGRARKAAGAGALAVIAATIAIPADVFGAAKQDDVSLGWVLAQAVSGTLAMALAAVALLAAPVVGNSEQSIAAWFAPLAFGVFLVHPFINDAFDIVVPPFASPQMLAIRFLGVLVVSTLIARSLYRSRRFAHLV